ncbi:uncharacterized protein CANTADRAFT_27051 [Suhomyces tanzawaensis NRRL Y-17324]|uniref:Uncharacterized protein n=1 Tax=Suhomyces tanzawaensis NRRL Y-17324 TaxID=984487 RepID=A0A1E4SF79_9ASCO|nr:uncharacterized protein CANTADRAFT_27051 [Suhomyces tanzawaensis NRRL Y-17324]ODV78125.1 hypothetical protein CANTADRAFT_27051 [Suhomyces tanzawaensis NRRL Y-17324]
MPQFNAITFKGFNFSEIMSIWIFFVALIRINSTAHGEIPRNLSFAFLAQSHLIGAKRAD